jgi:16S rRNA (guanine527-N7)-methyltransferase
MQANGAQSALSELGVSRETYRRLEHVVSILGDWRQKMNLVGPREMEQIWPRHIVDSAQLLPQIPEEAQILDIGSGAGFPGLVLACAAAETGGFVTMVESTSKKCAFLQAVISEVGLPARVINKRIEAVDAEPVDFITARALAPLPRLVAYAFPWLSKGATGLFFKGERWQEELTDAADCWSLLYEAIPSRTSETGIILKIEEAHRVQN